MNQLIIFMSTHCIELYGAGSLGEEYCGLPPTGGEISATSVLLIVVCVLAGVTLLGLRELIGRRR